MIFLIVDILLPPGRIEPLTKVALVRYRPVFPALRVEPSPDWSSIVPVRVARTSSRSIDNSRDVVIVCHRLAISNSFLRFEHTPRYIMSHLDNQDALLAWG